MRTMSQSIRVWGAVLMAIGFAAVAAPAVGAEPNVVGIVTDYNPRGSRGGKPFITIVRGDDVLPVKEHEILYEHDHIDFAAEAGPKAFVKALVNAQDEVMLDAAHNSVPGPSSFLQSWLPRLVTAYRWVNAAGGEDKSEPRNALSREGEAELDTLSVFPRASPSLAISADNRDPLWIGWTGGTPPFAVSISRDGKILQTIDACQEASEASCTREVLLGALGQGEGAITISVRSADGTTWTKEVKKEAIPPVSKVSDSKTPGPLSLFLHATDLLNRDAKTYVLESARELASISHAYPPARTVLNRMKTGEIP